MKYSSNHILKNKKNQYKRLLFSLLPSGLRYIIKAFKYKKRYPLAYVDERSSISSTTLIEADVSIMRDVQISAVNCVLKKNSSIQAGVDIRGGAGQIIIGENVQIAPYCFLISEDHNFKREKIIPYNQRQFGVTSSSSLCKDDYVFNNIIIGDDSWIGANVTLLKGSIIGKGCVVAAGSVVTGKKFDDYSIIAGVPAKQIGSRIEYVNESEY